MTPGMNTACDKSAKPVQDGMANLLQRINEYGVLMQTGESCDNMIHSGSSEKNTFNSELEVFINGGGSGSNAY